MNLTEQIISSVAYNYEYETEYDGQMLTYCFYCGAFLNGDDEVLHDEDCLHIKALKLIEYNAKE